MPRKARIVVPGMAHHVTQRGNYRQKVFENHQDFRKYAYWMMEYAAKHEIKIMAYCLMPNHVHFIVTPKDGTGLARVFNDVHKLYSQYKHGQKNINGHLWQGRFYSCVLSDQHLYQAIRYVEQNPVRAGIVPHPWDYAWSSAREHLNLEQNPILKTVDAKEILAIMNGIKNWKEYLQENDPPICDAIRRKTQKGLALGSEEFIIMLEQRFNRVLREIKTGRPPKIGSRP